MKYMLLINNDDETPPPADGPEAEAEMQKWFAFDAEVQESGDFVAGEALHPGLPNRTVRRGSDTVTDGPFAEGRECIGGFYVLDVDGVEEAVAWAKKLPGDGTVDVVACMDFEQ